MSLITLDQAIDAVMQLPLEQQEMLIDIVRSRHIESRRRDMAKDAQESLAAFHAGALKAQPLREIITELRQSLAEPVIESDQHHTVKSVVILKRTNQVSVL